MLGSEEDDEDEEDREGWEWKGDVCGGFAGMADAE